jgi:hypothetical protein
MRSCSEMRWRKMFRDNCEIFKSVIRRHARTEFVVQDSLNLTVVRPTKQLCIVRKPDIHNRRKSLSFYINLAQLHLFTTFTQQFSKNIFTIVLCTLMFYVAYFGLKHCA